MSIYGISKGFYMLLYHIFYNNDRNNACRLRIFDWAGKLKYIDVILTTLVHLITGFPLPWSYTYIYIHILIMRWPTLTLYNILDAASIH